MVVNKQCNDLKLNNIAETTSIGNMRLLKIKIKKITTTEF